MPLIPARSGVATFLRASQKVRVLNPHGHQVVDTWAFVAPSQNSSRPHPEDRSAFPVEYMSMPHSRVALGSLRPSLASVFVTNRRQPILQLTTDTSPGVHDILVPACDLSRYHGLIPELAQSGGYHENCSDNLHTAMQRALPDVTNDVDGLNLAKLVARLKGFTPDPLNLFMNVSWTGQHNAELSFDAPRSQPGDFVELKALRDLVIAFSSCPQDVIDVNGGHPVDAEYQILD